MDLVVKYFWIDKFLKLYVYLSKYCKIIDRVLKKIVIVLIKKYI